MKCTKCGKEDFWKHGTRLTTKGRLPLVQCKGCGHTQIKEEGD